MLNFIKCLIGKHEYTERVKASLFYLDGQENPVHSEHVAMRCVHCQEVDRGNYIVKDLPVIPDWKSKLTMRQMARLRDGEMMTSDWEKV